MIESLATALLMGGINTVYDFVWPHLKLGGPGGFSRFMVICFAVGMLVGARARASGGILISLLVLSTHQYLLGNPNGYQLYVPWGVFWIGFGMLDALLH